MSIQSIASQLSTYYSLDEILQDSPETATEKLTDIEETYQSYKDELNEELKTTDRIWLAFQAGQCEQFGKAAKSILYRIVKASVGHPENSIAAANAITILKTMRVSFSCLDLRKVQIPGADLSNAILDRADLSGADLENANLANASLNSANMSKTNLSNILLTQVFSFYHKNYNNYTFNILSSDNLYLATTASSHINVWHIPTTKCIRQIPCNSAEFKSIKAFSNDGKFLFISDAAFSPEVAIWSLESFKPIGSCIIPVDLNKTSREDRSLFTAQPDEETLFIFCSNATHSGEVFTVISSQKITTENSFQLVPIKEQAVSVHISRVYFSKQRPRYFFSLGFTIGRLQKISICDAENIKELDSISDCDLLLGIDNIQLSSDEKYLYVSQKNKIYSLNIESKDNESWDLENAQKTIIISEDDEDSTIVDMQFLQKSCQLVYIYNNCICLRKLDNINKVSRFRVTEKEINRLFVSSDEKNIFIECTRDREIIQLDTTDFFNERFQLDAGINQAKSVSFSLDSCTIKTVKTVSKNFQVGTFNVIKDCFELSSLIEKPKRFSRNYLEEFSYNSKQICKFNFLSDPRYIALRIDVIVNGSKTLDEDLYLFDTEKNSICFEEPNSNDYFFSDNYCFSDDCTYSAVLSSSELIIYNIPSKKPVGKVVIENFTIEHDYKVICSENFLKNPRIALVNSKEIVVFEFSITGDSFQLTSKRNYINDKEIKQLFLYDSYLVITKDYEVLIWDINSNKLIKKFEVHSNYLNISRDGSLLICYQTKRGQLCLWSIKDEKLIDAISFSLPIKQIQISPNNNYIVVRIKNGSIYVWEIFKNRLRLIWRTLHKLQAQQLILSNAMGLRDDIKDYLVANGAIKQ